MSIDKIKRKDGIRYRVRKQVSGSKRISKCFQRKVDAQIYEANLKIKPHLIKYEKLRFSEFAERFINLCAKPEMEISSVQRYQGVIRKYYIPKLGHRYLEDISKQDLAQFKAEIMDLPIGQSGKYFIVTSLKTMFRRAEELDFIDRSPALGLKAPRRNLCRMEYWTESEVRKFFYSVRESLRFPLYMIAFNTGMRLGELFGLKWDCLDLTNETITIRRIYCQKAGQIKENTKTNRSRTFRINSALAQFLREFKIKSTSEMVLNSIEMGCRYPAHASRCFGSDAKAAGIRQIRFHDIRHTFATQFVRNGGTIHAIAGILGHSSTSMTDRYAHFGKEHADQAANVVSFAPPELENVISIGHRMVTNSK